ncbi:ATP-binding cassette domain-containing protein [Mangrovimicrobium sediminis]|uniref:ATP-binding cassette domain-containing protein n=1 Tax=Mangrovimicrobium sediminis TaxID=2562682 RepID=A0A4Z0LU92_9GAMM|nr:ATP-binding cassette domain-containing protein [Haliea sp. SAOS-164]TGD70824.1 ATP-binding cassette domain-containing protein [Haliea sp. SAOS-164]
MSALVELQGFTLERGGQCILRDISLAIAPGEKLALVGPSGAGKSSLLGEIHRRLGEAAALCPQQLGLVDALSVYHNIYMAQLQRRNSLLNLWNLFFPLAGPLREVEELSQPLGLAALLRRPVAGLSGGERQRVALARACYAQRETFLGDEPVSSLDPEQGGELLDRVNAAHRTAVVALHNPALALAHFDRVIGLRGGELAFDRPAASLTAAQLADFYRGGSGWQA